MVTLDINNCELTDFNQKNRLDSVGTWESFRYLDYKDIPSKESSMFYTLLLSSEFLEGGHTREWGNITIFSQQCENIFLLTPLTEFITYVSN